MRNAILLFLILYVVVGAGAISRYEWNPTALVRFGNYYIQQNQDYTPDGAVRFTGNEEYGGNGYDGQIFYYYARTIFLRGVWPSGFSNAYRAPRVGYPFLAGLFSPLGSLATVYGMILVQLLLGAGSVAALYALLSRERKYLVLFYIFSPFSLQSFILLVSDSVLVSLLLIGYYFYATGGKSDSAKENRDLHPWRWVLSLLFFSLAVLTKESALFFLFPLGLLALLRLDIRRSILLIATLLPMFAWQFYLKQTHGMVPASILKIFLSPLSGVAGLLRESLDLILPFFRHPSAGALIALLKLSARWILLLLIPATLWALSTGKEKGIRRFIPFPVSAGIILATVLIADHYYFWGVYENISRMFTLLVPVMVLDTNERPSSRSGSLYLFLSLLSGMVLLRILFLSPVFPHDSYHRYVGPSYAGHAPLPRFSGTH